MKFYKELMKLIKQTLLMVIVLKSLILGINGCDFSFKRSKAIQYPQIAEVKKEEDNGKTYALLINGSWNDLFHNFSGEIDHIHNSLIKSGMQESEIYIVSPQKNNNSKSGLEIAIKDLSEKVKPNDRFLLYVTNHGGKEWVILPFGESIIKLGNDTINETQFAEQIERINSNYSVMVFSQCYSGGFAERLGRGNNIALSESRASRTSNGIDKSSYSKYFFPALLGDLPEAEIERVDKDGNRVISIEEALDYTSKNDFFSHPLMSLLPFKNTYHIVYQNKLPHETIVSRHSQE